MTISSQPTHSYNDLFNSDNTISITSGPASGDIYVDSNNMNSYTIPAGSRNTAIGREALHRNVTAVGYNFNWGDAEEFVDAFPDWQRVQDMCKKYPGLAVAMRNFQTVYTLVKDDYDHPKDES